jgi:hypothetical protein
MPFSFSITEHLHFPVGAHLQRSGIILSLTIDVDSRREEFVFAAQDSIAAEAVAGPAKGEHAAVGRGIARPEVIGIREQRRRILPTGSRDKVSCKPVGPYWKTLP